jgi:capsular polysaccharide biosynthesis protein
MGADFPDDPWVYDEPASVEWRAKSDRNAGLVSLAFIKAALRRRARFWMALTVIGLLVGVGLYVKFPPAYKANVSIYLQDGPGQDPTFQILTDEAMAQSDAVATGVLKQLKLSESVAGVLSSYTVTDITTQVLMITAGASSPDAAVRLASAIASSFLQVRGGYAEIQQQQTLASLQKQVTQAQQHLDSINQQISQVSAQPPSGAQKTKLASLRSEQTTAEGQLGTAQQYAQGTAATTEVGTQQMIQDSRVINAATLQNRSKIKLPLEYIGGGLIGGLAIGLAIVVLSALLSSRLRSREDVAAAMGAPVRFSVGRLRRRRLSPGARPAAVQAARRRVTEYLGSVIPLEVVPSETEGTAALAVVAVDNADEVADVVADLAGACAEAGRQVVVADLTGHARAAHVLGVTEPGVHPVTLGGAQVTVAVPGSDEIAPTGPFRSENGRAPRSAADKELLAACRRADLVLTVAELDPEVGAEHLATWTTDVVAIVTAGRSSELRIRALGEMIRLAGMRLASTVLIGADKTDESIGLADWQDQPIQRSPA